MAWLGVLLSVTCAKIMLAKFKFGNSVILVYSVSPNLIDIRYDTVHTCSTYTLCNLLLVYNCVLLQVLLTTVRLALPSIARFVIYIAILFIAFSISGWLILGSYHSKVLHT